ncbi:TetR-like C-terminal domain-containing protein [Streptomyces sp. NPDC002668]|uniref:TetR-like C-terminal domain-containing protein n=1 Tax=Streptomyces sp. NPDC002668 TaxID=3154422 RepID=UPI003331D0FC
MVRKTAKGAGTPRPKPRRSGSLAGVERGYSVFKPEGRLIVRALALSLPGSSEAQAERAQHFERRAGAIQRIRERAAARGENPPPLDQILDQLIGPLYVRAIFGSTPPPPGYPELLVDRLLAGVSSSACLDTRGAH